jgi:hypothetical protein
LRQINPTYIAGRQINALNGRHLIPAVAVYAGANFSFGENPYLEPGRKQFFSQIRSYYTK